MLGKISILFFACLLAVAAEKVRYDNFKVFSVIPRNQKEVQLLDEFHKSTKSVTFWIEPRKVNASVLAMVPPNSSDLFTNFIRTNEVKAEMTIPNVQQLIDEQEIQSAKASKYGLEWSAYHKLDDINNWLLAQETNKNFQVKRIEVGKTTKGKTIYGLRIVNSALPDAPGVVLESGIHAGEWIAPAASSWMVNEILNDSDPNSLWRQFQYVYIPSLNGDGYEYTWTTNRLWRKNRKPYSSGNCTGVDLNRNWDNHWSEAGASHDPCSERYAGPKAFSEAETQTVSDFYKTLNPDQGHAKFDIYISIHSFSQMLMYPWGWTTDPTPQTPIWDKVAKKAVAEMKKIHDVDFRPGNIHDTIFPASGSSVEYYYVAHGPKYAFVIELRDDASKYGLLLPPEQIVPSGQELTAGIRSILTSYLEGPPSN